MTLPHFDFFLKFCVLINFLSLELQTLTISILGKFVPFLIFIRRRIYLLNIIFIRNIFDLLLIRFRFKSSLITSFFTLSYSFVCLFGKQNVGILIKTLFSTTLFLPHKTQFFVIHHAIIIYFIYYNS